MRNSQAPRSSSLLSVASAALSLFLVACGGGGSTASSVASDTQYSIGIAVTGLTAGTLVLNNNGGDALTSTANGASTFAMRLASGAGYAVTVAAQPTGLTCNVSGGTGTVASANVAGIAVTCAPSWVGTKILGATAASTSADALATDTSGNVYVTGQTRGDLDGNTLTGYRDAFITKYNSSGVKQYTRLLGVTDAETRGRSVAADTLGNVYITGVTDGALDGNSFAGDGDAFLTKYNNLGVKQFTVLLGAAFAQTHGNAVATDTSGNVYVAGRTSGGLDGNVLTGNVDFFVTKYNSSGVKQYTRQLGSTAADTTGRSIAVDTLGNVYVAGDTNGGLDGNSQAGIQYFFLTKYNSNGEKQYTRQLGVTGLSTIGYSVTTDNSGNVYVAGDTRGDLDGIPLTGDADSFLTKYNSSGVKQYTRLLGVAGAFTFGRSLATDASGNVYVGGETNGALDGNTLTGTSDAFVAKYNSLGVKQYTRLLGAAGAETRGEAVATDTGGSVFVGGSTTGALDGITLTGNAAFFVTRYTSGGVRQ